jgi:hypothetical protein
MVVEAVLICVALPALAGMSRRRALAAVAGLLVLGGVVSRLVSGGAVAAGALLVAHAVLFAYGVFLLGLAGLLASRRSRGRPVFASLLGLNPLGGVASPEAVGVDWLRRPRMYRGVTLGQFHAYRYPRPWVQGVGFFLVGASLLLLCRGQME